MNKYLSLIFLYNRASYKKILLAASVIPLSFLAIFFLKIGNPYKAGAYMLMERAFGGVGPVLLFASAILMALAAVVTALNGRKAVRGTTSTTGYTFRTLRISPIQSYFTILIYHIVMILIFWGLAVASLSVIGGIGLTMAGTANLKVQLALGLLRTDLGAALIPIADATLMTFNIVAVLALANDCAKSCYLGWHNGRPSFGAILVVIPVILVWAGVLEDTYIFVVTIILMVYTSILFGDVIFREKHPKGDPFKTNQYAGVMDMDGFEFDESTYVPVSNTLVGEYDLDELRASLNRKSIGQREHVNEKWYKKLNLTRLRKKFLPAGINMERANSLFGGCLCLGIAEHAVFLFKYVLEFYRVTENIKGLTISGAKMPYFQELQQHSYYGYILALLLVVFIQAYWNYEYYNKKTKSVYVMKMLPDGKEYRRTIWAIPVIEAIFIVAVMILHILFDVCVYIFMTPELALHSDYLQHMLPF